MDRQRENLNKYSSSAIKKGISYKSVQFEEIKNKKN